MRIVVIILIGLALLIPSLAVYHIAKAYCQAAQQESWAPPNCPTRRVCCAKGNPSECWCC